MGGGAAEEEAQGAAVPREVPELPPGPPSVADAILTTPIAGQVKAGKALCVAERALKAPLYRVTRSPIHSLEE